MDESYPTQLVDEKVTKYLAWASWLTDNKLAKRLGTKSTKGIESKPKDDAVVTVPILVMEKCAPTAVEMNREDDGKY